MVFDPQTGLLKGVLCRTVPLTFGLAYDSEKDDLLVGLNYATGGNSIGRFSPDGRMKSQIDLGRENGAFQPWGLEFVPGPPLKFSK